MPYSSLGRPLQSQAGATRGTCSLSAAALGKHAVEPEDRCSAAFNNCMQQLLKDNQGTRRHKCNAVPAMCIPTEPDTK